MRVRLPYGRRGLDVEVPDDAVVVEPTDRPASPTRAGRSRSPRPRRPSGPPLAELVGPATGWRWCSPTSPGRCPTGPCCPRCGRLERLGAGPERVVLLCATGTHRAATEEEMAELVGPRSWPATRIHHHRGDDRTHVEVGGSTGDVALIDPATSRPTSASCTGFVEPHFFAGFSGGPKGICPGLAATDTILEAHSPSRIADRPRPGSHRGQPGARLRARRHRPVSAHARWTCPQQPPPSHRGLRRPPARRPPGGLRGGRGGRPCAGWGALRRGGHHRGGHPLDRDLYQAVKGMAAAERVVADGGDILLAAACSDGRPRRRRLRPPAGRAPPTPPTWPRRPDARSPIAGRPRSGRGSCGGPGPAAHRRPERRRGPRGALVPGGRPLRALAGSLDRPPAGPASACCPRDPGRRRGRPEARRSAQRRVSGA